VANVARRNFVFVTLDSDEGIHGVGEAMLEWKTLAVVTFVSGAAIMNKTQL
jgi:L-alanine-DL-glutamate epimerase-like enolase superfamily enzyme